MALSGLNIWYRSHQESINRVSVQHCRLTVSKVYFPQSDQNQYGKSVKGSIDKIRVTYGEIHWQALERSKISTHPI